MEKGLLKRIVKALGLTVLRLVVVYMVVWALAYLAAWLRPLYPDGMSTPLASAILLITLTGIVITLVVWGVKPASRLEEELRPKLLQRSR